eukprot:TRINITY_DN5390_c4_g1_i1.p1 TRINITY_DN5390_c4_g1~~TRINITY_DN5390_c4_g1_i1.p1  ORF type:complete len:871 (+),score=114.95 TRINITY_DN5390_c4_g1_i1:52-2613(+)
MDTVAEDWTELGKDKNGHSIVYRRQFCYRMRWNVDMGQCLVAAAPFGGPVAITRNPNVLVQATKPSTKPMVGVYSSSGGLISQFAQQGSIIFGLDWSSEEYLITLFSDGSIFSQDIHGTLRGRDNLGVNTTVLAASFHSRGVAVLLADMQLIHVAYRMNESKVWGINVMASVGLSHKPLCLQVIPPKDEDTDISEVRVLISPDAKDSPQGTLFAVDFQRKVDLQTKLPHVHKIAVNPKGTQVATFCEGGYVNILSVDLRQYYAKFSTKSQEAPRQLLWCGNDVVACVWCPDQLNGPDSLVLIIAPCQEHTSIKSEGTIFVVPELDCMRLLMSSECGIFEKVPICTRDTFALDPDIPETDVTRLLDAYRDFTKQRAASVKSIRQLSGGKLENAVDGCIDVASQEWEPEQQQLLLKAAHYGKSFCKGYDTEKFVETCKALRVLNAVRAAEIGIPLTWHQYNYLSPQVLIDRLLNRRLHFMAYKISQYLDGPTNNHIKKILIHWAFEKVKAKLTDDEIVKCIQEKFKDCPGISYKDVAQRAYALRKNNLAIKLLEKEPKASSQVSLLISMQESEMALDKAIDSGDTDLVYLVMLRLKREVPDDQLIRTLSYKPVARDLFLSYCEHLDQKLLRKYFATEQLHHQTAFQAIRDYFTEGNDHNKRARHLREAQDAFSKRKDRGVERDLMIEQDKLITKQRAYAEKFKDPRFTTMQLSVAATLKHLFSIKELKEADKMKSDFGVSDKMFTWIKLRSLSKHGHWAELESWSSKLGRKSPIGFRPFFDTYMKFDKKSPAKIFVTKIEDYAERCEAMCSLEMFQEAIKVAEYERDIGILEAIRGKAPASYKATVDTAIARLGG